MTLLKRLNVDLVQTVFTRNREAIQLFLVRVDQRIGMPSLTWD